MQWTQLAFGDRVKRALHSKDDVAPDFRCSIEQRIEHARGKQHNEDRKDDALLGQSERLHAVQHPRPIATSVRTQLTANMLAEMSSPSQSAKEPELRTRLTAFCQPR